MTIRTSPNRHWDDDAYRQHYDDAMRDTERLLPLTRYRCAGCGGVYPSNRLRHESGGAWCPNCGGGSFEEVVELMFYNEIDTFAAAWLRELMKIGVIPEGAVDERSIIELRPDNLSGYTQAHFFAGIGVWSYALREAGWPTDRVTWTGSCPCQPFSVAGKGKGFADERHLWPYWFHLIRVCRPEFIFGEQVASKDGLAWLDLVSADLEGEGYTIGPLDTCAAGFGAPHIRQRLYWVAHLPIKRCGEARECDGRPEKRIGDGGKSGGMAYTEIAERRRMREIYARRGTAEAGGSGGETDALVNSVIPRLEGHGRLGEVTISQGRQGEDGYCTETSSAGSAADTKTRGLREHWSTSRKLGNTPQQQPTNGFWKSAEWLPCIDGKARPVEPCFEPLAHGSADDLGLVRLVRQVHGEEPDEEVIVYAPLVTRGKNRVGRLRGYGNCIVAPQAIEFVRAVMEVVDDE